MTTRLLTGLLTVVVVLAGCAGAQDDELQRWLADQRNQTRPKVVPLAEPKVFKPESYSLLGAVEPFSRERLTLALREDAAQPSANGALVAPELARRKQALEAYPLDSMTLVGSMVRAGRPVALVRVNNLLYQVRPGDYLGLNYGRVMRISETEVALREIVQDAVGEWIERTASLQLQER